MANRYVAFGYEIRDAEICIVERESEVVKNVYAMYIQGMSLLLISERLNMLPITYASDGRAWDKNMVKRILENPKYRGDKGYPVIISEEIANKALECKSKKYTHQNEEDKERLDAYRTKAICGVCGRNMIRMHTGSGSRRRLYWKCSNEECDGHSKNFNEKNLNGIVTRILNEIAEDLTLVDVSTIRDYEKDSSVIQAHSELIETMENPDSEMEDTISKIMNLASVKFNLCKTADNTAVTEKIKRNMAMYPQKTIADGKIIESVVRRIKIYPNKRLAVELINGKEFEKSYMQYAK